MNILLTGATGYIGQRLLPALLQDGHRVTCCVRDKKRFDVSRYNSQAIEVAEVDFLKRKTLKNLPDRIDVAYYLVHSMAADESNFEELEKRSALHFKESMIARGVKQVIYLSGIINTEALSQHLRSRKKVEEILSQGSYHLTTLRAGIIVGSGSASFEIIRDLVEKLPVMIAPRWLNTKSQPIAVRNVIDYLKGVLNNASTFGKSFDIGGPDILTYRQMLLQFAKIRGLSRWIITVPVMTPRLSSYWLYFVTSTSFSLAKNLVNSMKVEVICRDNSIHKLLNIRLLSYAEAIRLAFDKIEQQQVISSWKDAQSSDILNEGISNLIQVPTFGCFRDVRKQRIINKEASINKLWSIGGETGWYYANWLWSLRGFMDKIMGGVGLRRGRKSKTELSVGDALDFWRVLFADKQEGRLLLYAEMRLPGEAWLEFTITPENEICQTATFRPLGLLGRLYWYAVLPFHGPIFNGMVRHIAKG